MHIIFTEEEKEYLNIGNFKVSIKKDCPQEIKQTLEKKIKLLRN